MAFLLRRKKKRTDPVLEQIISELEMNMSNNYKDEAQRKFRKLERCFEEALAAGKLTEDQQSYYYDRIHAYREQMKGYSHVQWSE